ncbi:MAG: hypothetical protein Q4B29_01560 [Candidatus Saccharibacteria bacterium]|nr:hypothetical protein [Candidatus Saccharibacteria bacterium]
MNRNNSIEYDVELRKATKISVASVVAGTINIALGLYILIVFLQNDDPSTKSVTLLGLFIFNIPLSVAGIILAKKALEVLNVFPLARQQIFLAQIGKILAWLPIAVTAIMAIVANGMNHFNLFILGR